MTTTETLKLALEALEGWKEYMPAVWEQDDEKAVTALREALAEQKSGIKQVIELYDSPDQPAPVAKPHEQEPVASIGYWNQKTGAYYKPDQISASHQKLIEDGILRRCYTAPPQRLPDKLVYDGYETPQYIEGWNDCREFMKGMK